MRALLLMVAAGCGDWCEVPRPPVSMTPQRARSLAPSVTEGLALSTTRSRPPCPDGLERSACDLPPCGPVRAALRVFVVPSGVSVPVGDCEAGLPVGPLSERAVADSVASDGGEWVHELPAGAYRVALAEPGAACARCGPPPSRGCLLEVLPGRVTARDLLL